MVDESGSFDLPLSLFGGRFGKDENTPADEFLDDDGISNMVEGGLTLKVRYEMINNNSLRCLLKSRIMYRGLPLKMSSCMQSNIMTIHNARVRKNFKMT